MEGLLTALIVFAVLGGVTCALACVGSAVHIVVTVLNMLGLLPKGLVDSTVGRSYDKLMYCRGNKFSGICSCWNDVAPGCVQRFCCCRNDEFDACGSNCFAPRDDDGSQRRSSLGSLDSATLPDRSANRTGAGSGVDSEAGGRERTPAQRAGVMVGMHVSHTPALGVASTYALFRDDGTDCPMFKLVVEAVGEHGGKKKQFPKALRLAECTVIGWPETRDGGDGAGRGRGGSYAERRGIVLHETKVRDDRGSLWTMTHDDGSKAPKFVDAAGQERFLSLETIEIVSDDAMAVVNPARKAPPSSSMGAPPPPSLSWECRGCGAINAPLACACSSCSARRTGGDAPPAAVERMRSE